MVASLGHPEANHKNEKRPLREQETIFSKDATDKELISKIYEELLEFNMKKTTQSKKRKKNSQET